jgi:hypothetical protein
MCGILIVLEQTPVKRSCTPLHSGLTEGLSRFALLF